MGQRFFLGYLAAVLAVVLIALAASSANKRAVVAETLLSEKQRELGELEEEAKGLKTLVDKTFENISTAARRDASPAVRQYASELQQKIDAFKARFGEEGFSESEKLLLRLFEAKGHIGQEQFEAALEKITDRDAEAVRLTRANAERSLQAAVANEVDVYWVRASGQYGLREWNEALGYYRRIHDLEPDNLGATGSISNCLFRPGRPREALGGYNQLVLLRTRLVEVEKRQELANDLAMSFSNRAIAYATGGQFDLALTDVRRAIHIWEHLVNEVGMSHLSQEVIKTRELLRVILEDQSEQTTQAPPQ